MLLVKVGPGSCLQGVNCLGQAAFGGQPLQRKSENMLETSTTSPRKWRGSGREWGAGPALLSPPILKLRGPKLVASAHWQVARQMHPHQVPAGP